MNARHFLLAAFAAATFHVAAVHAAPDGNLEIQVYNPGQKGIFPVSSSIVSGKSEAVLIDAQFARSDAQALVEKIKAGGKPLKTLYISHSDPDFYFGAETIKAAFPDVRIVATPQTVAAIRANKDGKLAYWGPILKGDAPTRVIVPEPLEGDTLTVDGHTLQIKGLDGPAPDRTVVWVPSKKAVLGGVLVFANDHVWIADTQTPESRRNWIAALDGIAALKPAMVVPGHYLPDADGRAPYTVRSVEFTRTYIQAFEAAAAKAADSAALIAAMEARYPKLAGKASLELSAKVIKGEMQWPADPAK